MSNSNHPILKNIRILDFSWVLAGPYATRILADFGAEVIKVQPPMSEAQNRFSRGYYNTWNRNKRGITLNLNQPEGIALARKLVSISNAVVENFTPRVMVNWGLDYPNLKKIKPDIIMLSMSTMGQTGPYRDYVGFGPTVQAFSGITHHTSYLDNPPSGIGYSYADHVAGLYGCLALLSALEYRRKTEEGQHIDLSEVEAISSLMIEAIADYTLKGIEPKPSGNSSKETAPYGVFRCQGEDRWCAITISDEEQWQALKQALGNPEWMEDKKFSTLTARLQNTAELDSRIEDWTSQHTAEEVMILLQQNGVPAGVVQNAADIARDPQLRTRKIFIELEHPEPGETVSDASPIKLTDNPAIYRQAAPIHGQDNDYVYKQLLEMSGSEINELKEKGVI